MSEIHASFEHCSCQNKNVCVCLCSKEHLLEVFHETLFITSVSLIIFDLLSKNTRTWDLGRGPLLRFTNCSGV